MNCLIFVTKIMNLKTYLLAGTALFIASCTHNESKGFSVVGEINGLENGFVKLVDENQNVIDSVNVQNGRFILNGAVEKPKFVYLFASRKNGDNCIFSKLLIENKSITMKGNAEDRKCQFFGATLNDEYMEYVKYLLQIPAQKEVQKLYNELAVASANNNHQLKYNLENKLSIMRDSVISELMRYKQDASRSQAAAALVYDQTSIHSIEEKRNAVSKFDSDFEDSYYLNKLREEVNCNKPDGHTAENSLDYWGTYKGVLPAADCPGIKTSISINKDKTYVSQTEYIGEKNKFTEKGKYTIDGNIITLTSSENNISYYKVEEGRIRKLDNNKHIITGTMSDKYILKLEVNNDVDFEKQTLGTGVDMEIRVASETRIGYGVSPQTCLLVKYESDAEKWQYMYSQIEGFDYEPGYEYVLLINRTELKNPPQDASRFVYKLKRIIVKQRKDSKGLPEK